MAEIVDVHEKKKEIGDKFKKTPVFTVNDHYLGLAWFEGDYKKHRHDKDEVFYVIEGELTIEVNGETHVLKPGMAIKIKAGEEHRSHATFRTLVAVFEPQDIKTEYLE